MIKFLARTWPLIAAVLIVGLYAFFLFWLSSCEQWRLFGSWCGADV